MNLSKIPTRIYKFNTFKNREKWTIDHYNIKIDITCFNKKEAMQS